MKSIKFFVMVLACALTLSLCVAATDTSRDFTFEEGLAADLKALGLFSGVSENDFDLERVPTRTEVLVMLIRVLGEEKAALEGEWTHPFTDVPAWADKYVGYAYAKGLTKGVSETKFGTDNASSATYLTFMLRALGYSDAKGDFKWDAPHKLAKGLGMLPSAVDTDNFLRADIVTVSYAALNVNLKGSTQLLAEKLIEKEVFSAQTYGASYTATKLTDKENEGKTAFLAEDIYAECSPAVFYIETFDENGEHSWSGSGFFIDESGIGVTTFYTLEGAASAEITLPGSGVKHKVSGVYDMSAECDWIVFQVEGSGFTALEMNTMPVKGAANVYTIGSPEGLQNTVAQGIVSNARRILDDKYTYIQTSAPISAGSDGGALVNGYGEVIGIVYESYSDGQNLNFAIPISAIAGANTETLTPYNECNWNRVWYYSDTDEVTVKAGEVAVYSFDFDYSLGIDGEEFEFDVTSNDGAIASAALGLEYGTIRIVGNKAGTTAVVISDNLSDDTHTVTVTVEENPEYTAPKVVYNSEISEFKLEVGATKYYYITVDEFGVADMPDGALAANYTFKSSSSAITVEAEQGANEVPHFRVLVKGSKKATGEITVSNDKTNDTLVIPVTVGDRYKDAFGEVVEYLIVNGELKADEENPENTHYSYTMGTQSTGAVINYYPKDSIIVMGLISTSDSVSSVVTVFFEKNGDVSYAITIPSYNVFAMGEIVPNNFGKSAKAMTFSDYDGASALKSELQKLAPKMVGAVVFTFDVGVLPTIIPGMDMTDFGFVNIDYKALGITE